MKVINENKGVKVVKKLVNEAVHKAIKYEDKE